MNLLSLLDTISAFPTPSATAELAPQGTAGRRNLLRAGARALAASLPLVAALPAAGTAQTTLDSLRLLLTLADLQAALYTRALATAGLVPPAVRPDIVRIQQLQQQQAAFLRGLFVPAGALAPAVPTFDFSGSHNGTGPVLFPNVFTTFDGFLQLAQPLADAAARFYLGQLSTLVTNTQLLGATLRRQAVEARQAAHLRTLRRGAGTLPKSWPSPTDPAAPAALATIQADENNTNQLVPGATAGTLHYLNFNALFSPDVPVQTTALAEAFDEPLPTDQAVGLLALFQ